jgi:uncharacterized membrane protein YhaH (DUF805 family)
MSLREQLFGFSGRIRRTEWWGVGLATGVIGLSVYFGFRWIEIRYPDTPLGAFNVWALIATELVLMLPFLWIQTAINVKRGHDLGLPAWPFVAFQIFATTSGYFPYDVVPLNAVATPDQLYIAATAAYLVGNLILVAVLGLVPGKRGSNRFGPSPEAADKPAFMAPSELN